MPHRYAAAKLRALWRVLGRHSTITTVVLVAVVAVPGYLKLQAQADENGRQSECNGQAWSLLANVISADNGPWAATHEVLTQQADEAGYRNLRNAVNARFRLSDDFEQAVKAAAAECGEPLPLAPVLPPVPDPPPGEVTGP